MESPPEEVGQDLAPVARDNTADNSPGETERSGLVNPASSTKTNMLNVVNNVLCCVYVFFITYLCFADGITLFSFHPVFMAAGWLLLMVSAINAVSPGDALTEKMSIQSRPKRHWVLQVCGLCCVTTGFIIIVVNKINYNKQHFTTYHSCLGLTSYILAIVASCGGIFTLYSMSFRKMIAPVIVKIIHASAGLITFALGILTMVLGQYSMWWNAGGGVRYACTMILTTIMIFTMTRPAIKAFLRIRERMS